jgi:hypothetical protein
MESRSSRHSIREFVNSLEAGTRVIWIANGTPGTVQPDKTILWDDGHHMTHKQMRDAHALLIHSEAERRHLQEVLSGRLNCLKRGGTLISWDAGDGKEGLPECLCPLAILPESESHSVMGRRRHHMKAARAAAKSLQPNAA